MSGESRRKTPKNCSANASARKRCRKKGYLKIILVTHLESESHFECLMKPGAVVSEVRTSLWRDSAEDVSGSRSGAAEVGGYSS